MKTEIKTYFSCLALLFLLTNCASNRTSTIVGGEYNETKNETGYFVIPYGSVSIPGKWRKTNFNSISRQQFFTNNDSITLAIAFSRYDKYEFNTDGQFKGFDFVNAYYEWDSKYFVESHGLQRQKIESDSLNGFLTYRIFGQIEKGKFDTYWLVNEKNGNITNISISDTDKWTESEKLTFMKSLIKQKEE
ncbi:MAG: hypothetical protein KC456_12905 [Flavobacteriales bacterium]|jgi:hypothetical protein|nr:hypothetical protein [Flavobacteriales bacterium]